MNRFEEVEELLRDSQHLEYPWIKHSSTENDESKN